MVGAIFLLFWGGFGYGDILFPVDDPYVAEKQTALSDLSALLPVNSAIQTVLKTDKVILWANSVSAPASMQLNGVQELSVPSFTPVTTQNRDAIRIEIEKKCECSLMGKEIAGIIVAHPYQAALMYFKEGWMNHKTDEIDGTVPPIVIIYHELAHASDYLQNENVFFDIASLWDKRWKNGAEQSAVNQQNELTIALASQKGLSFSLRRSYGKNRLYTVDGLYSVEEKTKQTPK